MSPRNTDAQFQAPGDLAWQVWDTESVVFNPRSGDTHLLDLVAAEGLQCLQHAALTPRELWQELAERLELEPDPQLQHYVRQLLDHFEEIGLARRSVASPFSEQR